MNKEKEYIKNTIILFLGKFSTQFMSMLLLPLYTHFLLTDDYGAVDLIQTYIMLFVPVLTLRIDSASFRFLVDKRNDKEEIDDIINSINIILFFCLIITLVIALILNFFIQIKYFKYVILNLIVLMISNVFLQTLRGFGKNNEYSIASIITGALTLILNILFIVVWEWNASSILISSTIANIISLIYILKIIKINEYFNFNKANKKTIKEIIEYSLPMIPNSLSWWIVNVSDRTIISLFLGTAFNGVYTVSCKFSNILNSVFSIFNMSWQETATLHIDDPDKDIFFTDMINKLLMFFASLSILILAILPFVYNILIGNDYISSYNYIPILLYSNSWNVLIGLIGGIYVAKKRTQEIATTTIISAIINIIVNLILIKFIGLYAACISTLISYVLMGIYRYVDCQKYVKLKLNIKNTIIFTIIFVISSLIYLVNNILLNILNLLIIIIYSIVINKDILKGIVDIIKNKIDKNKNSGRG